MVGEFVGQLDGGDGGEGGDRHGGEGPVEGCHVPFGASQQSINQSDSANDDEEEEEELASVICLSFLPLLPWLVSWLWVAGEVGGGGIVGVDGSRCLPACFLAPGRERWGQGRKGMNLQGNPSRLLAVWDIEQSGEGRR